MSSIHHYHPPNEKFITSCTHRLLQLQNQLQTQHLKQQLISSLTMKELSLRKLIEEQDLLILYLKDQLRELEIRKSEGIRMEAALVDLQEKYLALGELKSLDLVENEKILTSMKQQYHQLHQILNQLTKQSSTLYELKLKLGQRNSFTKNLVTQKISQFCQVKEQYQVQSHINEVKRHQLNMSKAQHQKFKSQNVSLTKQLDFKHNELESNKIKLLSLQQQVKKYETQKAKLLEIHKAAQNDNFLLKETLKEKINNMKQKDRSLKLFNETKQALIQQKINETQRLDNLVKQNVEAESSLNHELEQEQNLKSRYSILLKEKFTTQAQLQKLQNQTTILSDMKRANLNQCLQNQQKLEKNLYFIDQYMLINSELINQIQILLSEEINKQAISSIHLKRQQTNRSYQVLQLKEFLSRASQEMHHTERNVQALVRDFHNYKLQ